MKAAAAVRRIMMSAASSASTSSTPSASLKLLGPSYTRTFRCLWMLEELQVPYEMDETVRPQSRAARQYHPTGKVPVLLHYINRGSDSDEVASSPPLVLTESLAINTYLGDTFARRADVSSISISDATDPDHPPLRMPIPGTLERVKYDEILCQILSELDASSLWVHHKHNSPDLSRFFGAIPQITSPCRRNFAKTNQVLAKQCHPYLLGSIFTPVDIAYVHCLEWAMRERWNDNTNINDNEKVDDEEWPTELLKPYLERCRTRPAYRRAQRVRKESLLEQQRWRQQKQQQQQHGLEQPSKL